VTKVALAVAAIFRKVFAPALLGILPQHSELWTVALVVTIAAGAFDQDGSVMLLSVSVTPITTQTNRLGYSCDHELRGESSLPDKRKRKQERDDQV